VSVAVLDEILPVPEIDGVQFIYVSRLQPSLKILEGLELAKCLNTIEVIQRHIIGAWKSEQAGNWPFDCKKQAAELILRNYSGLSPEYRLELQTLPLIPVMSINGEVDLQIFRRGKSHRPVYSRIKGIVLRRQRSPSC
jgi:hypothetical protein